MTDTPVPQSSELEPEEAESTQQAAIPEVPESELPGAIMAMLYASAEPARLRFLSQTTGYDVRTIRSVLDDLEPRLASLGLLMQWCDQEHVQLATQPHFAGLIRRFLGIERTARLSPAALEVLAIVGYRQPVTRPEIDAVRGVDSSGVIQTLVARELIEPVGRLPGPGNPVQFGTTPEFLRVFGLRSLEEMPEIPKDLTGQLEASGEPDAEDTSS